MDLFFLLIEEVFGLYFTGEYLTAPANKNRPQKDFSTAC